MRKSDFIEYYKTLTSADLLEILANRKDYQDSAIEAAQQEIDERNLSGNELEEAKQILHDKNAQKEKQIQKVKAVENKIKNAGNTFIDTINPIQPQTPATDKIIKVIALVYGGIFLFTIINESRFIAANFKQLPRYPILSLSYLAPLFLIPIAVFLFFKRKTAGWIVLTVFVSYTTTGVLWIFIHSLTRYSERSTRIDSLFPAPSPMTYFVQLAFLIGTLYMLCKKDIRDIFKINKQRTVSTIAISGLFGLLVILET